MRESVTVIIPSIPQRAPLLMRAQASVEAQLHPEVKTIVKIDHGGKGPTAMRNEAILEVDTEWVAFLDDDDEFLPEHLAVCFNTARESGADLVYPWFELWRLGRREDEHDPLRVFEKPAFGQHFTSEHAKALDVHNFIPVTVLVRTAALRAVGGFPEINTEEWPHNCCEDWGLWRRLRDNGFSFAHCPHRTWRWYHHGQNSFGNPTRVKEIYG